ncbi:FAD binding domain-containing protein [Lactarius quietus]|nr:FAD binding domain-containing protein [Lactarius quietus]
MVSSNESRVDVLVVGAGPAGLMCGNALARAGVNVRIVDKRPVRVAAGQADGIQPRTIESYGLADRLLSKAGLMIMAAFYKPGPKGIERIARVSDVTAPTARYPYKANLHQGEIEAMFLDSMKKECLEVERPLEDPHAYPVKVVLKHLAKQRFVVGADGAHSWVRKTLGFSMDGEQTDCIWGVLDIVPSEDSTFPDTRNRVAIHSTNGSDMIRLYVQLSNTDAVNPETGRVDPSHYNPQRLMEVANKTLQPYTIGAVSDQIYWWTIYQIGHRVASKFTAHERVFITGDACHTHSPKAGQGMNASMNDSHNLAWKLTHVLRSWADVSLLKTYEFERRKYAQDLIAFDKEYSTIFSSSLRGDSEGQGPKFEELLRASQKYGNFSSGMGVHYAPSVVTDPSHQAAAENLIIGQCLLPHVLVRAADIREFNIQDLAPSDSRFKLFVFPGEHADKVASFLERPEGFFNKCRDAYSVITVLRGDKTTVDHLAVPPVLRPHWTKVLLDDTDVTGTRGGQIHERYVVVRPDGYVGTIAPLDRLTVLDDYFGRFMLST